jgi:hypothetical protein
VYSARIHFHDGKEGYWHPKDDDLIRASYLSEDGRFQYLDEKVGAWVNMGPNSTSIPVVRGTTLHFKRSSVKHGEGLPNPRTPLSTPSRGTPKRHHPHNSLDAPSRTKVKLEPSEAGLPTPGNQNNKENPIIVDSDSESNPVE